MTAKRRTESVTCRAFAKINLDLRVLGVRPDGYHELRTTFQSIALADTLTFTRASGPFRIDCDQPDCPTDRRNLVWRAAELVWKAARRRGAPRDLHVKIIKRIPMQAGLGGGSSDAAAAIDALAVVVARGAHARAASPDGGEAWRGRALLSRGRNGARSRSRRPVASAGGHPARLGGARRARVWRQHEGRLWLVGPGEEEEEEDCRIGNAAGPRMICRRLSPAAIPSSVGWSAGSGAPGPSTRRSRGAAPQCLACSNVVRTPNERPGCSRRLAGAPGECFLRRPSRRRECRRLAAK